MYGPPIGLGIGRGGGESADVAGRYEGGGGEIWKVDGCLLVLESTQNNGCALGSSDFDIFLEIQYASCVFGTTSKEDI